MDSLNGNTPIGGDTLEVIKRLGVDGVMLRRTAKEPGVAYYQSITALATLAADKTIFATYMALRGQLISFVDDMGNQYDNVAVMNVEKQRSHAIMTGTGFSVEDPKALMHCQWIFQFTELTQT